MSVKQRKYSDILQTLILISSEMLTSYIPLQQEQEGQLGHFTLRKGQVPLTWIFWEWSQKNQHFPQRKEKWEKSVSKIYNLYIYLTDNLPAALKAFY